MCLETTFSVHLIAAIASLLFYVNNNLILFLFATHYSESSL